MSVRTRIGRLERSPIGRRAVCPACGGEGRPACRVEWDPGTPAPIDRSSWTPPPEPEGCPRCGKARLTVIRVVWEDRTPPPSAELRSRQKA